MSLSKSESSATIYPLETPFKGTVNIPGSKSYTNRALLMAALANGETILHNCSNSSDSLLMIYSLKKLGIKITPEDEGMSIQMGGKYGNNSWKVRGNAGKFKKFKGTLNVKDAGTVMRFLTALCCLIPGEIILKGSKRMHQRPIKALVDALLQLGADITYLDKEGFAPLKIRGGNIHGGKVEVDASQSSQFISALIMIAPLLDSGLEIIAPGEIVSRPYIDMTIEQMRSFGVTVENKKPNKFTIPYSTYSIPQLPKGGEGGTLEIEPDASSASFLLGIAVLTQSTIRIPNLSPLSQQGDVRFADLLLKMGCKVETSHQPIANSYIEVTGVKELKSIEADMKDMPDAAPALAVVAAFAKGTTKITGLKNLELKESKRLTVLQAELTKMGISCNADINSGQITIEGGNPHGAIINTYNDHRIAMAFAMAGTGINDITIQSDNVVSKSFPDFWKILQHIGVRIDFYIEAFPILPNIIFIGFMGSGKSTVGKLLAKKLNRSFYETDRAVLRRTGFKSVNSLFAEKGEKFFRETEKQIVSEYAHHSTSIISCGGGIVANSENMKLLKKNSKIIYLHASFKTICERLIGNKSRPLFKDIKKAKKLYIQRESLYEKYADIIIYTNKFAPDEVVSNILSLAKIHNDNVRNK